MGAPRTQPVEPPPGCEKPDRQEKTVDEVARANQRPQSLTDYAQNTSCNAERRNAFRKNAFEHEQRKDQDTNWGQDANSIGTIVLRKKHLGSSREGCLLYRGGSCHVVVAQIHQDGRSTSGDW